MDQILLAVDNAKVTRVEERDLEPLENLPNGVFKYRYQVPFTGDLSEAQLALIRARVPVGVHLGVE